MVRDHRVRVLDKLRETKDASRQRAAKLAKKLIEIEIEVDEEKIEEMSLSALKDQFSAHKHRAQLDSERQPLFKLLKSVLKGTDPSKRDRQSAHEAERQRMIDVLKHTLRWRKAPPGTLVPSDLFNGLERTGTNDTILGSTADSAVSQQTVAGRTDGRTDGETDRGGSDANVDSE